MARFTYFELTSLLIIISITSVNVLAEDITLDTRKDEEKPVAVEPNAQNDEAAVFSDMKTTDNSTDNSTLLKDGNLTSVNSSNVPTHKWPCKSFNISETPMVVIMNNESTYNEIFAKMNSSHGCGLLLFYSPYCEFCTDLGSLYNAIGRSYPSLAIMAVDTLEVMGMGARYGVVGIPTVFFFYSGKAVSRYNRSRTPEDFQNYIEKLSGYRPVSTLNITQGDLEGPIPTTVKKSRDYYMIFSLTFLCFYITSKLFGAYILNALTVLKSSFLSIFKRKEKEE